MVEWKYNLELDDDMLVMYLDIIGFSNMIISNQDVTPESANAIINFDKTYECIVGKYSEQYQMENEIKFLWVSDSIFICTKKENVNILFDELNEITRKLLAANLSVRGGISLGKAKFERNIWGPAVVNAVEMEKVAIYPRILIQKNIVKELKISNSITQHLVTIPNSGYSYFDFLGYSICELVKDNSEVLYSTINVYAMCISENFAKCSRDTHKSKWAFLCNRLIVAVQKYLDYDEEYINKMKVMLQDVLEWIN